MLYVGQSIIHSVGGGVFSNNPQRILVDAKDELKVLRYKEKYNSDLMNNICEYAAGEVGTLYSKTEAMNSVTYNKSDKKPKNKKQFCSRLVAQSYYRAGIALVENENYCSPEDLNLSSKLTEVLDCVIEAKKEDIEFANSINPIDENKNETFIWLKQTRKLFLRERIDIQNLNDVGQALLDNSKFDKTVCKYIESTKYLELYNVDRKINPSRYDIDLFEKTLLMNLQNHKELLESNITLNERELEKCSINLLRSRNNYRHKKLKYFKLHIKLYRKLLIEVKTRVLVLQSILIKYPASSQSRISTMIVKLNNLLK